MGFAESLKEFNTNMTALADIIREKTDSTSMLALDEMVTEVSNLGESNETCTISLETGIRIDSTYPIHVIYYKLDDSGNCVCDSITISSSTTNVITTIRNRGIIIIGLYKYSFIFTCESCTPKYFNLDGSYSYNSYYITIDDDVTSATINVLRTNAFN